MGTFEKLRLLVEGTHLDTVQYLERTTGKTRNCYQHLYYFFLCFFLFFSFISYRFTRLGAATINSFLSYHGEAVPLGILFRAGKLSRSVSCYKY